MQYHSFLLWCGCSKEVLVDWSTLCCQTSVRTYQRTMVSSLKDLGLPSGKMRVNEGDSTVVSQFSKWSVCIAEVSSSLTLLEQFVKSPSMISLLDGLWMRHFVLLRLSSLWRSMVKVCLKVWLAIRILLLHHCTFVFAFSHCLLLCSTCLAVCPANWTPDSATIKPNPKDSLEYFEKVN